MFTGAVVTVRVPAFVVYSLRDLGNLAHHVGQVRHRLRVGALQGNLVQELKLHYESVVQMMRWGVWALHRGLSMGGAS